MFAKESGYFDVLLVRRLNSRPTVSIEGSLSPFGGWRSVRNPWRACFYRTSGCRIVSGGIVRLVALVSAAGAQIDADIGRQPLEQRTCVAGFGLLSFLSGE